MAAAAEPKGHGPHSSRKDAMINVLSLRNEVWHATAPGQFKGGDAPSWFDLVFPTPDELARVGRLLGLEIPTKAEMDEIEHSSRLYQDNGAWFMTAMVLSVPQTDNLQSASITFILTAPHLVTVRYLEPRSFETFAARLQRAGNGCASSQELLIGLLETIIDRMADILELHSAEVEKTSRRIFARDKKASEPLDLQDTLKDIGSEGNHISTMRESLASVGRMAIFLSQATGSLQGATDLSARVKTIGQDLGSLADYAAFMANKVQFLLDATLGMITIQQNNIIKIVSVAAAVFLPPTLIASIYGMNFGFMPELGWELGYPLAILLMFVSAILPYLFFKRKGWL